ncbi:helix-turn-helix transcriptional regulator [Parabacteroides acidifaciens]|uniref:Helix-turn-helix transcriptional regulator n=1 Tax=Parabacteroides acidifaciens TaxID=2290935 RepID=A0A3D8HAN5_9BACT|nr:MULTISPECIES: helix-turn-helix transcriptional regulator [Parabacteroides]MBC8603193.1 helix-turn-helix transcriptional regulator [Parabacteroides acidifaciens]RDU48055.1 XRE family transcriptional regulator [Parabacteroides acidifaciens]RHO72957.1 XRE family transcriptional regulator [Parabacteroides sp. AF48-14]
METEDIKTGNVHQGANVRKFRQLIGMKQEVLADLLGINQQSVSRIEQKRVIEEDLLVKIANILHISPEIIQKLEENPTSIVIENNTFQTGSSNVGVVEQQRDNIVNHPVDQLMELNKEQASLYERMLALEKEKNALLEKLLKEK